MAMTKKEHAEMDALREARDLARAMRWPEYPDPARLPVPTGHGEFTTGWDINAHCLRDPWRNVADAAYPAWTGVVSHGRGHDHPGKNGSQQPKRLYATHRDALLGLRLVVTEEFARALAKIDAAITAQGAS